MLNMLNTEHAWMGRIDQPGASWALLMVTVVLVRAMLPEASRVMLMQ